MTDTITIRGHIGTEISSGALPSGDPVCNFRVASTERRLNDKGEWEDVHTNWYTVACFRKLAQNVQTSLNIGDRVIIHGRLRFKSWPKNDGGTGLSLEISADSVGPDLGWGTANFKRNVTRSDRSGDNAENSDISEASENSGSPQSAGDGVPGERAEYVTHPETGEPVNTQDGEVLPLDSVVANPSEGSQGDERSGSEAFGQDSNSDEDDVDEEDYRRSA